MNRSMFAAAAITFLVIAADSSMAGPPPSDVCEASKNKTAGSYFACREKAEATAIKKSIAPDYSKCTEKFDDKWAEAEAKGAGACPDNVLTAPMNAYLAGQAASAALIISGAENIPSCGDGDVNAVGEECDGADLRGKDCTDFAWSSGSLSCDGSCQFDGSGCSNCPGVIVGGFCWVLGAVNTGCDTACAAVGLVYDSATDTYAGGNGTNENCGAVAVALGLPGPDLGSSGCSTAVGCVDTGATPGGYGRCTNVPTTSSDLPPSLDWSRICACQ